MSNQDAERNEQFGTHEYWQARYTGLSAGGSDEYDWFKKYDDLREVLDELVPDKHARILMLGCGNSSLSADMYHAGYTNIINVDFSSAVIQHMATKYPYMAWVEGDITRLADVHHLLGGPASFDVAIDKGTMDALMAEKGSVWNPSDRVRTAVAAEVDGVISLLKPKTGRFIYLTFGQPHFRRPHLLRDQWHIETRTIGDMFHYYLYIGRML